MVRVSPADSKQDARQIVVDLAASLVSHIPLLQSIFSMSTYEFSFRAVMPTSGTFESQKLTIFRSGISEFLEKAILQFSMPHFWTHNVGIRFADLFSCGFCWYQKRGYTPSCPFWSIALTQT